MSRLVDAYRAARPPDQDGPGDDARSLEQALEVLYERGRAAHLDLDLDEPTYGTHLARCGAPVASGAGAVHAEDLYVVCAALGGIPAAVDRLRRTHRPTIAAYLRAIESGSASIDEIEQRLWEALLVGTAGKPPRLATYSGKGSLGAFLGIAAQRIAIDSRRHGWAEQRAVAGMASEANAIAGDAELGIIKHKYKEDFERAVREAMERLEDRDRMLLRMHIVDGLTFDSIAKVYGVTQPTVSRWVARARELVITEMRRLLREQLRLPESEFDSLAGLVVSQLDVSVSRVLRRTRTRT
jgi:RNA polymerase sigma-70 factor (ECF subfamily)